MPTNDEPKKQLEQIKADILASNICPDLAQGATQLVMGHGNPKADIVFIGEAPGKNEDLQGIPFVGAAGKLLDEMLAESNIQRSDVYITNIVKYRPPNNRDPWPEEKRAFWPYLLRELKVIQPKAVVTLGRHSMEYFLPNKKITEVHGKAFRAKMTAAFQSTISTHDSVSARPGSTEGGVQTVRRPSTGAGKLKMDVKSAESDASHQSRQIDVVIVPLYHPAAALYNGSLRETLFNDFKIITNIIN